MAISILVVSPTPADLLLDGHPLPVVVLHDQGRPSERVDAAIAQTAAAWTGCDMPPAALLPDGRLLCWEPGLLHAADADLGRFPLIGQVSSNGPPVFLRPDGAVPWTRANAVAAGILTADGRFVPWRRPRIVGIVSREVNEIVLPNVGSTGPHVRQFAKIAVRLDNGSEDELQAFWHVPAEHLAAAGVTLPGLPITAAHEWLSEPLRRRVAADARVLCSGGGGLDMRCEDTRLRLEPAPDGELLFLEGIVGHCMMAGVAVAALGDQAATLGGNLVAAGGAIWFEILGIAVVVELSATDAGGLRVRCTVDGSEEIVDVGATDVRTAMADLSGYLAACGDLSVAADGGAREAAPKLAGWLTSGGSQDIAE